MRKAYGYATLPTHMRTLSTSRAATLKALLVDCGYEMVGDVERSAFLEIEVVVWAMAGRRCSFCKSLEGTSLPDESGKVQIVSVLETGEAYCGCAIGKTEMYRRQEHNRVCQWCTYGWKEHAGVYLCTCEYKCKNSECSGLTPSHGTE